MFSMLPLGHQNSKTSSPLRRIDSPSSSICLAWTVSMRPLTSTELLVVSSADHGMLTRTRRM